MNLRLGDYPGSHRWAPDNQEDPEEWEAEEEDSEGWQHVNKSQMLLTFEMESRS